MHAILRSMKGLNGAGDRWQAAPQRCRDLVYGVEVERPPKSQPLVRRRLRSDKILGHIRKKRWHILIGPSLKSADQAMNDFSHSLRRKRSFVRRFRGRPECPLFCESGRSKAGRCRLDHQIGRCLSPSQVRHVIYLSLKEFRDHSTQHLASFPRRHQPIQFFQAVGNEVRVASKVGFGSGKPLRIPTDKRLSASSSPSRGRIC